MRGLIVEWPMVSLVALSEAAGLNDTNVRTRIAKIYRFMQPSLPAATAHVASIIGQGATGSSPRSLSLISTHRKLRRCAEEITSCALDVLSIFHAPACVKDTELRKLIPSQKS